MDLVFFRLAKESVIVIKSFCGGRITPINYVAETDNEDTDTIEWTETEASSNNHESEADFDVRDAEMMSNNCIQGELCSNQDDATFDDQMPP